MSNYVEKFKIALAQKSEAYMNQMINTLVDNKEQITREILEEAFETAGYGFYLAGRIDEMEKFYESGK